MDTQSDFDESVTEENVGSNTDIIKPINRDTVHRICSGQVVLSLAIAVKELIENAMDAGAKNIEVRIKDYGMELVEVIDNGSGVRKENFPALTLKHYTSKIREFSDLESVSTLGFRGEALSSLCALSSLSVTTRHSTAEHGTKIQYDNNGQVVSETPVARSPGTTVSLANLFSPLPVRRKEYVKNHKREFNKMCNLLYAYCLVAKGVKFTCTNQTPSGSASNIVSTQGSSLVKDNIVNIFGPKQISTLIEVNLVQPDEQTAEECGTKLSIGDPSSFEFEFFISSVVHGNGRSSTDRQFYFINSRPCEPTKIMKAVNELYRQYNSNQYPFVFLNIIVKNSLVDVNVTPDKRQIFLEKEKLLLATVKSTLIEAFKNFPATYKMQNTSLLSDANVKGQKRNLDTSPRISALDVFRKKPKTSMTDDSIRIEDSKQKVQSPLLNIKDFKITVEKKDNFSENGVIGNTEISEEKTVCKINLLPVINNRIIDMNDVIESPKILNVIDKKVVNSSTIVTEKPPTTNEPDVLNAIDKNIKSATVITENPPTRNKPTDTTAIKPSLRHKNRRCIPLDVSLDGIRSSLQSMSIKNNTKQELSVKFRSQITPKSNKAAEDELQKQIEKDMFSKMRVIGQFNYAFIVVALKNDLFIIDQHASDEKYNFEELQRTTVLDSQPLVSPKELQLTASNEIILIDNEQIFKKNGFHFAIHEHEEATKKVKLTKIPVSKSYIFGKDDIEEMLYMLQEGCNDASCRPSRVRGMFASRACRKSVMVGKALSKTDMRRLVDHMGEIDQPWNCPHGRPTMRHLVNLNLLQKE